MRAAVVEPSLSLILNQLRKRLAQAKIASTSTRRFVHHQPQCPSPRLKRGTVVHPIEPIYL